MFRTGTLVFVDYSFGFLAFVVGRIGRMRIFCKDFLFSQRLMFVDFRYKA